MMIWLLLVGFGLKIGLAMILLIGLLVLRDGGSLTWSLTFVGVLSLPVPFGILSFWSSIVSLLLTLVLRSMTMAVLSLHPTVWSSGGLVKKRRVRVSAWEFAWVPGPVGLWRHGFISWPSIEVCGDTLLGSWLSFVDDLGVGGVSFIELLILYERWAGERLVLEMSVPKLRRLYRPISVSAVPFGPSIDIWRSCRFFGAMLRDLGGLPGGLGRFLPCRIGANHCRLRSIGWERCGHGLTSRPLVNFSHKKPTWGCRTSVVLLI